MRVYARVTNLRQQEEAERWRDIINRMYLPEDKELGIFVQNDGFLDKELNSTDAIPPEERPINQHWSWDRILRSCYIKQSDVLLGLYLYYFNFDKETVRRNFDFYETMTVHESSLSPHIHSILAARIGEVEKAYQLFLHATRLDLDDYNNETHQGLHITSMPGSWLALYEALPGMQILEGLTLFLPSHSREVEQLLLPDKLSGTYTSYACKQRNKYFTYCRRRTEHTSI